MAMRLSELHPSTVHFPLVLLPVAVGVDTVGRATGSRRFCDMGQLAIVGATISAAIAGVFGLIAQEEVSLDQEGTNVLRTHRTLNLGLLGALAGLSVVRSRQRWPSIGYLVVGFGAFALAMYSAYLGGELVYRYGAGVERARGVMGPDPELTRRTSAQALSQAAKDLGHAISHTARDIRSGEIAPSFRREMDGPLEP